jgi:hypothetical protein
LRCFQTMWCIAVCFQELYIYTVLAYQNGYSVFKKNTIILKQPVIAYLQKI